MSERNRAGGARTPTAVGDRAGSCECADADRLGCARGVDVQGRTLSKRGDVSQRAVGTEGDRAAGKLHGAFIDEGIARENAGTTENQYAWAILGEIGPTGGQRRRDREFVRRGAPADGENILLSGT